VKSPVSPFPVIEGSTVTIGRYQVSRQLGAGALGDVYAARDPTLKRELAIKLLRRQRTSPGAELLQLRGARSAAQLVHASVVRVFDAGLHDGRVFIAMELVNGQAMSSWLRSRPPWRASVAALAQAARGLEAAHARGFAHRDFKPANVLLGTDGRVRVTDFGLAREDGDLRLGDGASLESQRAWSRHGEVAGTPTYMAPEQFLGAVQDPQTDQYAFCVSLYEALLGHRPFGGRTLEELKEAILSREPPWPQHHELPPVLVAAVARGLSKSPTDRFTSMGELASLLEAAAGGFDLTEDTAGAGPGRSRPASYEAYVRGLPDGLETALSERSPSFLAKIALARRPLRSPPAELIPVLARIGAREPLSAVQGTAILAAIYDQHFTSMDRWRDFMGEVSFVAFQLVFVAFALPHRSSPHYVDAIVAHWAKLMCGLPVQRLDQQPDAAQLRLAHPPRTVNELFRIGVAEALRTNLRATGCSVAEVEVAARCDDGFELKAKWR
jgi:Protein kinase domain